MASMNQRLAELQGQMSQNQGQNQMSQDFQNKIHEECSNYKTFHNPGRAVSNKVSSQSYKIDTHNVNKYSDWQGEDRYRFVGPFTRMAVKGEVNRGYQCGTQSPGYIVDPKAHDMEIGEMKEFVKVCFFWKKSVPCVFSKSVTITRCPGDFFVYRVPDFGNHNGAYCGAK